VKIEQSALDSYPSDKEILVNQLKHYSSIKEATPMIFADKTILNGFEHYGMDRRRLTLETKSECTFSFMIRPVWSSLSISLTNQKPSFSTTADLRLLDSIAN